MTKIAGVDVLLYANTGTGATPTYTVVGGQSSAVLNRDTKVIDVTSKESGWTENLAGIKSWSIDCDGYVVLSDIAYTALETAWENGDSVKVHIVVPSGSMYEGDAIISKFPLDAKQDGALTFQLTLEGTGALVKTPSA